MIRRFVQHLAEKALSGLIRISEVGQFEGVRLADLRRRSASFQTTIIASLELIKETDPRRFRRVQREIVWIVNCTLSYPGAEYCRDTKTCRVDFEEPTDEFDTEFGIGWWARTLVHEATHGVIAARGIPYCEDLSPRIERVCVEEENRFIYRLSRVRPALAERLYREYSEADWKRVLGATRKQEFISLVRRARRSRE